jgi:hypothetical protein
MRSLGIILISMIWDVHDVGIKLSSFGQDVLGTTQANLAPHSTGVVGPLEPVLLFYRGFRRVVLGGAVRRCKGDATHCRQDSTALVAIEANGP